MGKLAFISVQDDSGFIQLYVDKKQLDANQPGSFAWVNLHPHCLTVNTPNFMYCITKLERECEETSWQLSGIDNNQFSDSIRFQSSVWHNLLNVAICKNLKRKRLLNLAGDHVMDSKIIRWVLTLKHYLLHCSSRTETNRQEARLHPGRLLLYNYKNIIQQYFVKGIVLSFLLVLMASCQVWSFLSRLFLISAWAKNT